MKCPRCLSPAVTVVAAFLLSVGLTVSAAEPLVVGHTLDYEPLNFMRKGQLSGIEVDNAREVAAILQRPVETVVLPFNDLLAALESGQIDVVMAGISVTPEREDTVLFTEPFMEVGQMAIILADNAATYAHPRAVFRKGVRIGVEPGTTGERFVRDTLPSAAIKPYANSAAAFAALRSHEVDIYVHDAPTSWRLAVGSDNADMLSMYRPLTQENLAWAVRKDNTRLAAELNAAMDILRGNGRLRAIQNYWIPIKVNVR